MLHITTDANVPFARQAFGAFGRVETLPGREITARALARTDALVVRSVTEVDAALLDDTPVRWVGTATAGTDHVDAGALRQRGVAFASAPGSNAASVVDWVLAALLAVAADRGEGLAGADAGDRRDGRRRRAAGAAGAGAGAGGDRVRPAATSRRGAGPCGDGGRAGAGRRRHAAHAADPRWGESEWPTRGLIDLAAAATMRRDAWLVNAPPAGASSRPTPRSPSPGRAPVLLDVWPNEPDPSPELVAAAAVATPHVAGYAWDGKVRGTRMLADALRQWARAQGLADVLDWRPALDPPEPIVAPEWMPSDANSPKASPLPGERPGEGFSGRSGGAGAEPKRPPHPNPDFAVPSGSPPRGEGTALGHPNTSTSRRTAWLDALARRVYDVRADDARFRAALADAPDRAAAFAELRRSYPQRRELSRYSVTGHVPDPLRTAVTNGLGLSL